jgi:hypothetical protein
MSKTAPSIPTSLLAATAAPQETFAFLVLVLVQVAAAVAYPATAGEQASKAAAEVVVAAPEETVGDLVTQVEAEVAQSSMVQAALTSRPVPVDSSVVVQAATSGAMAMVAPAPEAAAVEED